MRCIPLGLVPKKAPGEFRLIHHLSWPEGELVNDFINPEMCSVKYSCFDDAIQLILKVGQGGKLAKCDVKSAFRFLLIHHLDFKLIGL